MSGTTSIGPFGGPFPATSGVPINHSGHSGLRPYACQNGPVTLLTGVETGHVVHFYDHEETLALAVADFLGAGLSAGGKALVVATPQHRTAFARVLEAAGVDVEAARDAGQYVELDAQELLAQFTVGGGIDQVQFHQTIPPVIDGLRDGLSPLRVYGEMVDLLWRQGNVQAAHDLEMLWNSIGAGREFDLFCGYCSTVVDGALPDGRGEVAHHHDVVVVAPSAPGGPGEGSRRFEPTLFSAGAARRFVRESLLSWGLLDLLPEAELVVSELATNAVVHTGQRFTVAVRRLEGDRVRLEVSDASKKRPAIKGEVSEATSGRGLRIVSAVADEWAVLGGPGGKTVWAVLAARPGHH